MLKMHTLLLTVLFALLVAPAGTPGVGAEKEPAKPIRALLITGGCCHDYTNQKDILTKGVSARTPTPVEWTVVHEGTKREHKHSIYAKPDWSKGYDVVVHDECFGFVDDDAFVEGIVKAHAGPNGVPVVAIHCAAHSYRK